MCKTNHPQAPDGNAATTAAAPRSGIKAWLPVISLTFSTFIFNTSEFIPIGLLSDIASDFGITESHAGLMITVYAWAVALASLPLMLIFAKTENRRLMLSIVTLFAASHMLSAIAPTSRCSCSRAWAWRAPTPYSGR